MLRKIKNKNQKRKEALRNIPTGFDHAEIEWKALEHPRHERGRLWYITVGVLTTAAIAWGLFFNAWTFSLVVMVFVFVYALLHRDEAEEVEVKISSIGIKVGHRKYPYNRIKAFWVIYEPPMTRSLYIRVNGDIAVDIAIELNDQNPAEVRDFLIERIPEMEGKNQSLTELFLRIFKI